MMQQHGFKFVAVLFLLLAIGSIPWESDFASSVIPGYHVTIVPAYPYSLMAITFLLLFNAVAYTFLRTGKLPWTLALLQLISILPGIFLFRTPLLFLNYDRISHDQLLALDANLLIFSNGLFFIIQLLFILFLIQQLIRKKRKA